MILPNSNMNPSASSCCLKFILTTFQQIKLCSVVTLTLVGAFGLLTQITVIVDELIDYLI